MMLRRVFFSVPPYAFLDGFRLVAFAQALQAFGDRGFVAVLAWVVEVEALHLGREVLLRDVAFTVGVGVLVSLPVAEAFAVAAGVFEVVGDVPRLLAAHVCQ